MLDRLLLVVIVRAGARVAPPSSRSLKRLRNRRGLLNSPLIDHKTLHQQTHSLSKLHEGRRKTHATGNPPVLRDAEGAAAAVDELGLRGGALVDGPGGADHDAAGDRDGGGAVRGPGVEGSSGGRGG